MLLLGHAAALGGSDPSGRRTLMLGRSEEGRPIVAVETGDLDSPRTALVVGCIHGNECAGVTVAERLARAPAPVEVDLWVVPDLNPDGAAANTRANARAVDLNRNFPWRWRMLSGIYRSGTAPGSERETRIAIRLIRRVRPSVSIWFHQHLDVVDVSSGDPAIEHLFASLARMRTARLAREPGSAVTWETHCLPGATAFVVELPAGAVGPSFAARLDDATDVAVSAGRESRPRERRSCVAGETR